jgi:hypothetical protein
MRISSSCFLAATRVVVTSGLLVIALVAGASDSHAEAAPVPTPAQLRQALLTVANLPDLGFQTQPLPSGASINSFTLCPKAAAGPRPTETAAVGFSAGGSGIDSTQVIEALQQYSVSGATYELAHFAGTFASCSGRTIPVDHVSVYFTIAREPFPSFGNGTVALRMTAEVTSKGGLAVDADIVAVRADGTVIIITNSASSQDFNPALTRTLVKAAYQKLIAHW